MKIQFMSDLHLEFGRMPAPDVLGDVLVLAGDIHVGLKAADFVNDCAESFKDVFYLFGNHEFYHNDMMEVRTMLPKLFSDNVTVMDNNCVQIDGINFVGSTLWANMEAGAFFAMNDSQLIANGGDRLSLNDVRELFHANLKYIESKIRSDMPNVVITHHAPSMEMVDIRRYGENVINTAYATDIIGQFNADEIALWISGHTHACMDKAINGIRCVSNCRGYAGRDEVAGFDPERVIEVERAGE